MPGSEFKDKIQTSLEESQYNLDKGEAIITIIEKGWSDNDLYYDKEALNELKELLKEKKKMYANHNSSLPSSGSRNIFEWASTINELFLEGDRLKAKIDFTENPRTEWIAKEAKKHPEEIQFSINAKGYTHIGEAEGKEGDIVDEVVRVNSVDVVSYGAAGGRLENIKESIVDLYEADWDTEYVNNLPDGAFAIIEPAYVDGETDDNRARHLPHHNQNAEGKAVESGRVVNDDDESVDLPHLRNAFARVSQTEPFTDSISKSELQDKAEAHLESHRDLLDESKSKSDVGLDSFYEKVKEVEAMFSELVEMKTNSKDNDEKEVDNMTIDELKEEYPHLMNKYEESVKEELKEELEEKEDEIEDIKEEKENIESELEDVKEEKENLETEVSKYKFKEKKSKRESFVSGLLEDSSLNISIDSMPKALKESLLNLDKEKDDVEEEINDLEEYVNDSNLVEDAGDTSPSGENEDDDEDVLEAIQEDDDKAVDALTE